MASRILRAYETKNSISREKSNKIIIYVIQFLFMV